MKRFDCPGPAKLALVGAHYRQMVQQRVRRPKRVASFPGASSLWFPVRRLKRLFSAVPYLRLFPGYR